MHIFYKSTVPSHQLGEERRYYYQSNPHNFRFVLTEMPPGHIQNEHSHDVFLEIHFILAGEVEVTERVDGEVKRVVLGKGDLVCLDPPHSHNLANHSKTDPATILTLKVPEHMVTPQEFAELCESDWFGYEPA